MECIESNWSQAKKYAARSFSQQMRNALCESILLVLCVFALVWKGGKTLESVWAVSLVSIACVVPACFGRKKVKKMPNFFISAVYGYVVFTVVSYIFSTTKNYGFDEVMQTVALALIFLTVSRSATVAWMEKCSKVLFAGAYIAIMIGVGVYVFQPVSRFVGTFFDYRFHTDYWPNAWGEYVLAAWPIICMYLMTRRTKSGKIGRRSAEGVLGIGGIFGALFLSYSRGSLIAWVVQIALWMALLALRRRWREAGRLSGIVCSSVLIGVIFFFAINEIRARIYPIESVLKKATFTSDEQASSITERSQFWHQAIALTMQRPWLGWGPYSFRFVQPQRQTQVLATADHPHNAILKIAMERGIPAVVFFICIIGITWWRGVQVCMAEKRYAKREREMALALLVAFTGVIAHSMIDYNLQFVSIALLFWIFAGCMISLSSEEMPPAAKGRGGQRTVAAAECIIALLLLMACTREGRLLWISSKARAAEAAGNSAKALKLYDEAHGELLSRDMGLSEAHMLLKVGDASGALAKVNEYLLRNAQDARAWKLRGDTQIMLQKKESAIADYKKAFRLGKYNDLTSLAALLDQMNAEQIEARLGDITVLIDQYIDAIHNNTHFIALSPNVEALVSILRRLSNVYPEQKQRYEERIWDIEAKAKEERASIAGRPSGLLW